MVYQCTIVTGTTYIHYTYMPIHIGMRLCKFKFKLHNPKSTGKYNIMSDTPTNMYDRKLMYTYEYMYILIKTYIHILRIRHDIHKNVHAYVVCSLCVPRIINYLINNPWCVPFLRFLE